MFSIFLQGVGLGVLLSISVGPVMFTILKLSMSSGHKAGFAFAAGVSLSDLLLVLLGNMAAELVRTALNYEVQIAAAGALLLFALGAWSFFFRKDPVMDNHDLNLAFRKRDLARFGLQGFFINILNPGPIFFWLTTCTAFAWMPLRDRTLLFGACLLVVLAADILKVLLAGKIRGWLTPATLHRINLISALILMGFGLAIAIGLVASRLQQGSSM